ncbi:phage tail protein [Streptomyces palmae]|uniref:phage tail protein n=1 Tax=Streptomyces palmae TaxID=1701085 RepID=UPI001432EEA5|nr:phage tail protein [Streptomyces palmae]
MTEVRAAPHPAGGRIDLRWRNPPAREFATGRPFAGITVVRRERTFPLAPEDGDQVYLGPVVSAVSDTGARPLTTHYYTVFTLTSDDPPEATADEGSRAAAFATAAYGLGDALYRMLPAVHRRFDLPLTAADVAHAPAIAAALKQLPTGLRDRGQLYRFLSVAGSALDLVRSLAEGLADLHDPDRARPEFLAPLAQMIGWELDRTAPVSVRRSEITAAPYLYRGVGTVPNLRAIVNRYTRWYVQVAEMAQSIARSNTPPHFPVFAVAAGAQGWRGADDAGPVLGFGEQAIATGRRDGPAVLIGDRCGPFALRPGMRITVTADDRTPTTVVFAAADFRDIARATAEEVADVLDRNLSETTVSSDSSGKLVITSNTAGAGSAVRVESSLADLVTLEGAPGGRLSVFGSQRPRLCYETTEVPGGPGTIRMKTYRKGCWGEAGDVPTGSTAAGGPSGVELPGTEQRLFLVWVDQPGTKHSRLRYVQGTAQDPEAASLRTGHAEPFALTPGSRLVVRIGRCRAGVRFTRLDLTDPENVSAAELAEVLSHRLPGVEVTVLPDRTVRLATPETGGDQRLEIELDSSDAAAALGFGAGNAVATGTWGDGARWSAPRDVPVAALGRVAEPFAVVEDLHRVRLFWSAHDGTRWTIRTVRWEDGTWAGHEVVAEGGGGNREPAAVTVSGAGGDTLWVFWSKRQGTGTEDDVWTLMSRPLDLASGTWGPERPLTAPRPGPGRSADREPAPVRSSDGGLRVYFSSDRSGESGVWSLDMAPDGSVPAPPTPVLTGPPEDRWPVPVSVPGVGTDWLLFRSDRGVALSGLASRTLPPAEDRSAVPATAVASPPEAVAGARVLDTGTLRRYAGSTTVTLAAVNRNKRRRQWDDLLSYTPCKPRGAAFGEQLEDGDLYTRGTIALFISPLVPDAPLSAGLEEQLRPLLQRFLPIGTRAVLVFAPRTTTEYLYSPGHDIAESYADDYPYLEFFSDPGETVQAALPEWVTLLATTAGHVSADPHDLTTFRRRAWFPPPA